MLILNYQFIHPHISFELKYAEVSCTVDQDIRVFIDEQRPISLTGDFPLYPDHLPVTVANYNNHVSKMLRNKASGFRCEYNVCLITFCYYYCSRIISEGGRVA